jgi:hypothetical protein
MAAFPEQDFRMGLLKIAAAHLGARNLRRDRQHRHPVAMTLEQAVDEVKIAGTAAAGADGEPAGHLRLGACRERGHFLMAHVHPADLGRPQGVREAVERIAHDAPDPFDAGGLECLCQLIGDAIRHGLTASSPAR